jgi:hypothetical protein
MVGRVHPQLPRLRLLRRPRQEVSLRVRPRNDMRAGGDSQSGAFRKRAGEKKCKTNPICRAGPLDCGLMIADCGLREPGLDGIRAKRTQFPPGRRRPTDETVQNEPNFAPPQTADAGNCAKQSQTWGDWSIWAKAAIVWGVARPGSETCKTNLIWGRKPTIADFGLRIGGRRPWAGAGA